MSTVKWSMVFALSSLEYVFQCPGRLPWKFFSLYLLWFSEIFSSFLLKSLTFFKYRAFCLCLFSWNAISVLETSFTLELLSEHFFVIVMIKVQTSLLKNEGVCACICMNTILPTKKLFSFTCPCMCASLFLFSEKIVKWWFLE